MKRVLIEGAFYSPYSSEGRWAFNITRLLSKLEDVELYILVPDLAKKHIFFQDFNPEVWFPTAKLIDLTTQIQFDTFFTIQGDDPRNQISAKRRVAGIFEAYWYGDSPTLRTFPADTIVCYGLQPYKNEHPHNNWPKDYKLVHLPYSPYYKPGSNNFKNKGILLTMKDPTAADFTTKTIEARLDHLRAAIYFAKHGIKVTVTMGHRMELNNNPAYATTLGFLLGKLKDAGATFINKVSPEEMEYLVTNHSVLYTGKVAEVALYAAFNDALCLGSVPIIFSDWPEQFFQRTDLFESYKDLPGLIDRTETLLIDETAYAFELNALRGSIKLCTEYDGIQILKGLIE